MPLFAALLSIPGGDRYPLPEVTPQRRKAQTLTALLDHMRRLAARQPILMLFEDLHWIDPTSLELLSLAIEAIRDQRILLVATARAEFTAPWPAHRHVSTLALNRLGRSDGETLIESISKGKRLPPEVRDQITSRTDGVPLFIEELTKTVLESGLLDDAGDHYVLRGPLPPLAIPSTLHASLLSRLDRLAAVKDVAQSAAAIGREFSYSLIAAVARLPERDLQAALARLVDAELVISLVRYRTLSISSNTHWSRMRPMRAWCAPEGRNCTDKSPESLKNSLLILRRASPKFWRSISLPWG